MIFHKILLIFTLYLSISINAQERPEKLYVHYDKETELYGYINKLGEVIIQPKFLSASFFNEQGYALVVVEAEDDYAEIESCCKRKWNFIDKNGEFIGEDFFSHVGNLVTYFENSNLVPVKICEKNMPFAYLNKEGEFQLQAVFKKASTFGNTGLAVVEGLDKGHNFRGHEFSRKKMKYLINEQGEVILKMFDIVSADLSSANGKPDSPTNFNKFDFIAYREARRGERKWGLFDCEGQIVIPPKFRELQNVKCNQQAIVAKEMFSRSSDLEINKWYFYDLQGNRISNKGFYKVTSIAYKGKVMYITQKNEEDDELICLNENLEPIELFKEIDYVNFHGRGIGTYANRSWKYGFIDIDGNKITDCIFDKAHGFRIDDLGIGKLNDKYYWVDRKGKLEEIPNIDKTMKHKNANILSFKDKETELFGFMNIEGDTIIQALFNHIGFNTSGYTHYHIFDDNGICIVYFGNKFGYINANGELLNFTLDDIPEDIHLYNWYGKQFRE